MNRCLRPDELRELRQLWATARRATALVERANRGSPDPCSPLGVLHVLATMPRGQYGRLGDTWSGLFFPPKEQTALAASAARRNASAERAEALARADAIPDWPAFEVALRTITDRAAMRADPKYDPRWEQGKPNEYVHGEIAARMAVLALLLSDADVGRAIRLDLWESWGGHAIRRPRGGGASPVSTFGLVKGRLRA
jgi:hypothetical protein